jgi:hypothetical protein
MLSCVYSQEVWFRLRAASFHHLVPAGSQIIAHQWLPTHRRVHKLQRNGFDILFALVYWWLWLERNARVFNSKSLQAVQLASHIPPLGSSRIQRPGGHHSLMVVGCVFSSLLKSVGLVFRWSPVARPLV